MANSNQKDESQTQVVAEKQITSEKAESGRARLSNSNMLFNGISLVVAIAAMLIAIYSSQSNNQSKNNLSAVKDELSSELNQLKENQANTQRALDASSNTITQTQQDFDNKLNSLSKQLESTLNQKHYENNDWILLKAKYYLELAQINGHWSKNLNSTASLLEQADLLLKDIHNPKLFTIRQTIAKEITQLKATEQIDITGILSKIDAAQTGVDSLSIKTITPPQENAEKVVNENQDKSGWKGQFQGSMDFLKTLVVIRRNNEPIQPIISPLFETTLKESIHLYLQEAQWAVLNNNPKVFQLSLDQAISNINRSFTSNSQNTKELIKQLQSLKEINFTQQKPVVGQAIPMLMQIIDDKTVSNDQKSQEKGVN